MKNRIFSIALALGFLLVTNTADAKIWRVNNNAGVDADFTDFITARNAASPGDTIHLEPSTTSYGDIFMIKRLHIVGSGYYLSSNDSTQAYLVSSTLGDVTFNAGSEGSSIA